MARRITARMRHAGLKTRVLRQTLKKRKAKPIQIGTHSALGVPKKHRKVRIELGRKASKKRMRYR